MSLRDHLPTPFAPILMNVPTKNPCTGPVELCQEEIGSFRYECKVNGFGRASTDSNCTDIVECSENQNPCTGPFEFCQTDSGSFMCDCTTKVFERPSLTPIAPKMMNVAKNKTHALSHSNYVRMK